MTTFPHPEMWRWTKQTVIGCLTCQSNGTMGGPWPMKAAMDSRHYIYIYIYAFSRRFYPKRLTVHPGYTLFDHYACSLGIEPTTFCTANAMLYHWATGTAFILKIWLSETKESATAVIWKSWSILRNGFLRYFQISGFIKKHIFFINE